MRVNKKRPQINEAYIVGAAYRYLERYATSEQNLKHVLRRKIDRLCQKYDLEPIAETSEWIDQTVAKMVDLELLNDQAYALSKAKSYINRGNSRRMTEKKLQAKGLNTADIQYALAEIDKSFAQSDADEEKIELYAAVKYARRRRFGAFAKKVSDNEQHQKHINSMCRAGFAYDFAKQVLGMTAEELEDILYKYGAGRSL